MADVSSILLDRVADWLTQSSLAGERPGIGGARALRTAGRGRPADQARASELLDAASALRCARLHLGAWRRHERRAVPHQARRAPGALPAQPLLPSDQQQSRSSAPAHRPDRRRPSFRSSTTSRSWASPTTSPSSTIFEIDTSRGMIGSWSTDAPGGFSDDMIAALLKHPEPSGRGRQDGRARPARRQHAHHLSRRRRRQARA